MSFLDRFTIKAKMLAVCAVFTLAMAVSTAISIKSMNGFDEDIGLIVDDRVKKILIVKEINDRTNEVARNLRNSLILQSDEATRKEFESIHKHREEASQGLAELDRLITTEKGKELLRAAEAKRIPYGKALEKAEALIREKNWESAKSEVMTELRPLQVAYMEAIHAVTDYQVELVKGARAKAAEDVKRSEQLQLSLAVLATLFGFGITFAIALSTQRSVGAAVVAARRMAEGDLSQKISCAGKDEISSIMASLEHMRSALVQLVREIQESAAKLDHGSQGLSATAGQISIASQEQSNSASAMAAAVEELTVSINTVSDRATEIKDSAKSAGDQSADGREHIVKVADEMMTMRGAVSEFAAVIRELGHRSEEVQSVTGVIKDIAEQTNLLALNAAIEAARAGEQGRGFAVVADEVRKLAERTRQATEEIGQVIGKIREGAGQAVSAMDEEVAQVEVGSRLAEESKVSIEAIQHSAHRVADSVQEITESLREQTTVSQTVAQSVERIAQMTEENSSAIASVADSANELKEIAGQLTRATGRLRIS